MSTTSFVYVADHRLFQELRRHKARLRSAGLVLHLGIMGQVELRRTYRLMIDGKWADRVSSTSSFVCEAYDSGRVYIRSESDDAIAETRADVVAAVLAMPRPNHWRLGPAQPNYQHQDMPERMMAWELRQRMLAQQQARARRDRKAAAQLRRSRQLGSYEMMLAAKLPTLPVLPPYLPPPPTPEQAAARQVFSATMIQEMLADMDRDIVRDVAAASD